MRVSVHILAVNAAQVIERGLRSLRGVVNEVVLVDSWSTDGTADVVSDFCKREKIDFKCVLLSPPKQPELFILDVPSTWSRKVPEPFTGCYILGRFDLARNLGLERCTGDVVVKLDADDEVLDPNGLVMVCRFVAENAGVKVAKCPYEVVVGDGFRPTGGRMVKAADGKLVEMVLYDRVWRNSPDIRFRQAIHEYLSFGGKVNEGLTNLGTVRDHRDSPGVGCRVPNRNYKVFLAEYERRLFAGEALDPTFLMSTVGDVEVVDPELARVCRTLASG